MLPYRVKTKLWTLRASRGMMLGERCMFERIDVHVPEHIRIGDDVTILRRTELVGTEPLVIGDRTFVNHDCRIRGPVTIGTDVHLAPGCRLFPGTHEIGPSERRCGQSTTAPIVIGDGAWLGAGVTVLPGVAIGAGTVIAAGAVVTRDCEPDALYAGVPAVLKRRLH